MLEGQTETQGNDPCHQGALCSSFVADRLQQMILLSDMISKVRSRACFFLTHERAMATEDTDERVMHESRGGPSEVLLQKVIL